VGFLGDFAVQILVAILATGILGVSGWALKNWWNRRNNIFISAPMASIKEPEYSELRDAVRVFIKQLRDSGYKVYSAIEDIEHDKEFERSATNSWSIFEKIRSSKKFVLIYFSKSSSGALVEAGYALARKKHCTFIYASDAKSEGGSILPWVLDGLTTNPISKRGIHRCSYHSIAEFKADSRTNALALIKS